MAGRTLEALESESENGEFTTTVTRYTHRAVQPRPKRRKQRYSEGDEACCSCSRHSSCKTSRCDCYEDGTPCTNCRCLHRCQNLQSLTTQEELQICGETNDDDEDDTSFAGSDASYTYTALSPPPLTQPAEMVEVAPGETPTWEFDGNATDGDEEEVGTHPLLT